MTGPNSDPFDFADARQASRLASEIQKNSSDAVKDAYKKKAQAEYEYRIKLGETITSLKAEGMGATLSAELARCEKAVCSLRMARDIAEGVAEAALQNSWRCTADRKDLGRFIDWSMGLDLKTPSVEPSWGNKSWS